MTHRVLSLGLAAALTAGGLVFPRMACATPAFNARYSLSAACCCAPQPGAAACVRGCNQVPALSTPASAPTAARRLSQPTLFDNPAPTAWLLASQPSHGPAFFADHAHAPPAKRYLLSCTFRL